MQLQVSVLLTCWLFLIMNKPGEEEEEEEVVFVSMLSPLEDSMCIFVLLMFLFIRKSGYYLLFT